MGVDRLRRHPGFLVFWAGLSSFLIVGRRLCLLSRRVPLIVTLVRAIDRAGGRWGLFRNGEDPGVRRAPSPVPPATAQR